ncbi:MAG: transcription initiation factor IIB [Candidatus Nitrosotenuis sp.]|nr:MAG: transcription initiation factor IIB [Candidatus Nitrosotenuis sp.]
MVIQTFNKEGQCRRCSKGMMMTDDTTGERFCNSCGFVILERVDDSGPERHLFSKDERDDKTRTGAPTSLAMHDMGLATIIGHTNRDATGKPLSSSMKMSMNRLRTWDSRSQAHVQADKNFRHAFTQLDKLRDKLALSDAVVEKTAYIYRKALAKGLVRGRSIEGLLAAAVYAACRDVETPRTLNDVSEAINVKRKDVSRNYRLLVHELELKMPVVDPISCMSKIASKVGLNEKTKRRALTILEDASTMQITAGKDPMGLAAAALYISCIKCKENVSQKEIALAAGVTEVTIRNRYKGLRESLKL